MYCNQCGKSIPDDAKFCHHCGSAVGVEQKSDKKPEEPQKSKVKLVKPKFVKKEKDNNQKNPRKTKKLVGVLSVLVFVAAVILGVNAIRSHQKVLAELPDPEYYFPVIDEIKEHDDVKTVIVRSDEELWSQVAGYVDLLKWSGKYPVTQSDEELYPSGDYCWNFVYNKKIMLS